MTIQAQIDKLRRAQILHILEEGVKFEKSHTKVSVEDYFADYWDERGLDGLYRSICYDLGIETRKECLDE